jgi:hypothetical protein
VPAAASLLAAIVVAAVQAAQPFEHGVWLVAYLALVGFAAQLLLGAGQAALLASAPGSPQPRRTGAQLVLWNLGVVAVPLGVFTEARLPVVIGAAALLAALLSFHRAVRPAPASAAYLALICFMAASTLIGTALAWDLDWL